MKRLRERKVKEALITSNFLAVVGNLMFECDKKLNFRRKIKGVLRWVYLV